MKIMAKIKLKLLLFFAISSVFMVYANDLGFKDQGDFDRVAYYFFQEAIDSLHREWGLKADFIWPRPDVPLFIFGSLSYLQALFGDTYSLDFIAFLARLVMLGYSWFLTNRIATLVGLGRFSEIALLIGLLICFFYAHNTAMLNSLYGEFVFMLSLPLLLIGLLRLEWMTSRKYAYGLIALAALLLGMAKIQYFFVPALVALCLLVIDIWRGSTPKYALLLILFIIQAICLYPLSKNDYSQLNYYHSLFYGSYLGLDAEELSGLMLSEKEIECVGVDAWGNKALDSSAMNVESGHKTCYGDKDISVRDILKPYLAFPLVTIKLLINAMPQLQSVEYFHVYPNNNYITTRSNDFNFLMALTQLRDLLISPFVPIILALSLFVIFYSKRLPASIAYFALFLVVFFVSQLAVSILGEGLRDLGKHMWAAQYGVDILVVLMVMIFFSRRNRGANGVRKS